MAKWFGKIGFAETKETSPGVWSEEIVDHEYYGDVLRNSRRLQASDKLNDDINISNEIMGTKWKITNVEVKYPRLVLTIGGLYNG